MKKMLLIMVVCSLYMFTASVVTNAANYTTDLIFQTDDQNIWESDLGDQMNYSSDFMANWNEEVNYKFSPANELDVEGWVEMEGTIGFEVDLKMDNGSVKINYPVGISLEYPDKVRPGETFTISSSFDINPEASMITDFSEASVNAGAVFDVYTKAGLKVLSIFDQNPLYDKVMTFDVSGTHTFADIETGDSAISLNNENFRVEAAIPDIQTTGILDGFMLASEGEDNFMEIFADFDKMIESASGISLSGYSGSGYYNVLDADAAIALTAKQEFLFNPGLTVNFELETGDIYRMPVGSSLDIVFPENLENLSITPTFSLDNIFYSNLILEEVHEMEMEASYITFAESELEIGPVIQDQRHDVISKQFSDAFQLPGFDQFTTDSFSIEATTTVPEPSTIFILGTGLALLRIVSRKKAKPST